MTPWTAAHQASLSLIISWSMPKFMSVESVMPSNHLILCYPLLLLPSIFSSIRIFSESAVHIRWPKNWSFSFSISPSNEYSELISFKIDWFDLHGFQGTFKSLLQHHNSKASINQHFTFFIVHFSHPYMTAGKNIALTLRTFVSKVISLLFNTLSRFLIAFLFRRNHLLISWLQSPSTVNLEPKKEEISLCFHLFSFYLPWSDGTRCHDLQFSSVAQSCLTLCDPTDCSTRCLSVHHQLLEFTQTHAHWVGDATYPTISSSVVPFSSCLQSFPASGSFQMSQLFPSDDQSIGVSASTSVLPVNIQDWFPLGWTGWISLQSKTLSRVFSNTIVTCMVSFEGGHDLRFFLILSLSWIFHSPPSPSSRDSSSSLSAMKWYHLHIWGCWYFSWQSWFQLVTHPAQHFA